MYSKIYIVNLKLVLGAWCAKDSEELRDISKRETPKIAEECIREPQRFRRIFASRKTINNIEKCRATTVAEDFHIGIKLSC